MKLTLALALSTALASPALAAPVSLAPHRAVYDLSPADGAMQMSESATTMSGRMVYEFTGAACEGFTVNFRFVVETSDAEGGRSVTDLRTSNHEEGDGRGFQFLSQTYTNQVLTEDVKGTATRDAEGRISVRLDTGEKRTVQLDPGAIFPTDHLLHIIEAARTGKAVFGQDIYDGSEGGERIYRTTAIIGRELSDREAAPADRIGAVRRWPVTVSYFDPKAGGDQTPEYSISFHLWENGVSSDMLMDYGDFALKGRLASYEPLPETKCE